MAFPIAAAAIMAGGSLLGGALGSSGSKKAAKEQRRAQEAALAQQMRMYNMLRGDLQPYREFGHPYMGAVNNLLLGDPAVMAQQLQSLPGYQFNLYHGLRGAQNPLTAQGLGLSGGAIKAGAEYATGLADSTYGQQLERLLRPIQIGQASAAQSAAGAANMAPGMAQSLVGAGQAQAAGTLGHYNALSGAAQGVSNLFMTNAMMQNMGYPGLFGGSSGAGGGSAGMPSVSMASGNLY